MSQLTISFSGLRCRVDLSRAHDISIPLDFHGPQPNHFTADRATAVPMSAGTFTGDTRSGGSCNAEVLNLTPHCNGTHTECVGHVTDERIAVCEAVDESLMPAALITVDPISAKASNETADPLPAESDELITARAIGQAWSELPGAAYAALVVRTLPNPESKKRRVYSTRDPHAYFSLEAMDMLVQCGVRHLLVDTPSVDRYDDEGRLAGHRRFWGMQPDSRAAPGSARSRASITEMIYVDDRLGDGIYLLDLQIAPFRSDAAPSRPLLYPLEVT